MPVFQVVFSMENAPDSELDLPGLKLSPLNLENETAKYDLVLDLWETRSGLAGALDYDSIIFERETIERMLGHFQVLLEGVVADPRRRLSDLPWLTEAEREQLLVVRNQTRAEYPIRHFVFASSSSVYGEAARVPFSEEDRTDSPESPYAATKKAGEMLCYTYHRLLGLPITCLRFFTAFGPRQRPDLAIHKFVRLIAAGEPIPFFGDGSTRRDYTYVEDIADGVLAALEKAEPIEQRLHGVRIAQTAKRLHCRALQRNLP